VEQHGDGATGEAASRRRIGAAGEDGGHAGAEDDAGQLRSAQVFKLLGEHVAALEIGDDEDVGLAGDGRDEVLDFGGLDADGGVKGQRAVEDAAGDLAAVGHLAEGGGVEGGLDLGVHGFDGRQQGNLGLGDAEGVSQVDGVLDDVDLVFKLGSDVDGRVGDEQGARVGRRIHNEDVADAAAVRRPVSPAWRASSVRRCAGCPSSWPGRCRSGTWRRRASAALDSVSASRMG
jgi:hypothetical protein